MTTHALVIAGFPAIDRNGPEATSWPEFRNTADTLLQTAKGVERLQQGVFLIRLDSGLQALCDLEQVARSNQVPFRVLFLDQAPVFSASLPTP